MDKQKQLDLINRIKKGEENAAKEFVNIFLERVRIVVEHKVPDYGDREELIFTIIGNIILRIKANKYEPERSQLQTFVMRMTGFEIRSYNRHRAEYRARIQTIDQKIHNVLRSEETEHKIEKKERVEKIRQILNKLPEKYRIVLELKFLKELSIKEIKEQLKLESEQKVSDLIKYAKELVRAKGDKRDFFPLFLCFQLY